MPNDRQEYLLMLEFLAHSLERMNRARGNAEWIESALGMAQKLVYHLGSLFHLKDGTHIKFPNHTSLQFVDAGSLALIARGLFETYLRYFSLFVAPSDGRSRDLQLASWKLAGELSGARLPIRSVEGKRFVEQKNRDAEERKKAIQNMPTFQKLDKKAQDKLLNGTFEARTKKIPELAEMAGFNRAFIEKHYAYLCGYVHNDAYCISQIQTATSLEDELTLTGSYLGFGKVVMAHFIHVLAESFPSIESLLQDQHEIRRLVNVWLYDYADFE